VLLDGNGEKNEVTMIAKHWSQRRVRLGAQARLPVLLNAKAEERAVSECEFGLD
jgi:hypothetical protein